MSARSFHGMDTVQEVQCSAKTLPPKASVLYMVLYEMYPRKVLLRANLGMGTCTSVDYFASCEITSRETRRIKAKALVSNLAEGQTREFGCNLTAALESPGDESAVKIFPWSLVVHRSSEYVG